MPSLSNYSSQYGFASQTFTAGETIQVGDVVALDGNGKVHWLDDPAKAPNADYKTNRCGFVNTNGILSLPEVSMSTITSNTNLFFDNNVVNPAATPLLSNPVKIINLQNGNIMVAWVDSSLNLKASVYNVQGVQVGVTVTVVAPIPGTVNYEGFTVAQLASGKVVFGWLNSTTNLKLVVYDSTVQTVLVAATTITASCGIYNSPNSPFQQRAQPLICPLSGGGFSILYTFTNGAGQAYFQILNDSLVVTKAETAAQTSAGGAFVCSSYHSFHSMAPLGTGFMIALPVSSQSSMWFQAFDASGNRVGTAFNATQGAIAHVAHVIPRPDGGVFIGMWTANAIGSQTLFYSFDNAFTQQSSVNAVSTGTPICSYNAQAGVHILPMSDGSVIMVAGDYGITNTKYYVTRFSSMTNLASQSTITISNYSGIATAPHIITDGSGNFYILTSYDNTAITQGKVWWLTWNGSAWINNGNFGTVNFNINSIPAPAVNALYIRPQTDFPGVPGFSAIAQRSTQTSPPGPQVQFETMVSQLGAGNVIGVALTANTAGGNVVVQTKGQATTRINFSQTIFFNTNGMASPGNRGWVAGNQAILMGTIPSVPRSIA